jgi:hypothetical protein
MPANYVLLEKIVVGADGVSSVTFSGIPQTGYTDLVIKSSARTVSGGPVYVFQFNGSSTGWSYKELSGYGTGTAATGGGNNAYSGVVEGSNTANTFNNVEHYIPNYAGSSYKTISCDSATENNGTSAYASLYATLWSNTAAITSITMTPSNGTKWVQYSTFYLYGVAKLDTSPAIAPKATGGDTVMTDGTYWYHTFISSGTFTPATALSVDYLVVAGGGAGGKLAGGGGGAGGFRTATGFSCASGTGLTVTVGAGGAGTATDSSGGSGSNSVFSSITSTGGGGGAYYNGANAVNGLTGGSGGGSGGLGSASGGTATSGQGNAGGGSNGSSGGGGGGGASVTGQTGFTTEQGGFGGAGTASTYSGASVTYAGGGGGSGGAATKGGAAGTGGGATGGSGSGNAGGAGTANTGGGGGGCWNAASSGNGGSGIVLVRYLV